MSNKPLPSVAWLTPRLKYYHGVSLFLFAVLCLLLLVWNLFFANLHSAPILAVLGIQLLPLMIVLPGMLQGNARVYTWCCFVLNLYFMQGVVAAFDPNRWGYGWIQSVVCVALFCSALLYSRYRFQYARVLLAHQSPT